MLKEAFDIAEGLIGQSARKLVYDNPNSVLKGKDIDLDIIKNEGNEKSLFWKSLKW